MDLTDSTLAVASAAIPDAAEEAWPEVAATDIAVVGRALRVPGARNVAEFWANLRNGVESIRRRTDDELRAAGVDPGLLSDPNYIKAAAPLADMELFDAGFFGFSPREAAIMDPQHRQFLEVAWEAFEDAGHVPDSFKGRIGVFGGSGMNAYMPYHLFTNPKLMAASGLFLVRHTGNDKDFLTTRVSYLFDLRGPSVNIQTACSTSLVAIHAGCQSLINQECDMALAGGVTIELPHGHGYLYQEGEILSPDGHCRAFDARAKGTVFGSGAGIVVLRRLQDALADGDTVYAVIKASAVNNDGGRKVGYLAPSVDGQAEAVAEALNLSGVPADSISYIECHGTGTPVGDPIEVAGLTHAFRSLTDRTGFCALGSLKTNIGHLDTAAGVAGFVKVVEMLRHATLVPTLHYRDPNPEVDWPSTPFYVNDSTRPWKSTGPRRASVNSLGVGGTNAHVVLEEAPPLPGADASRQPTVFLLSARSKTSLDRAAARLADHLEGETDAGSNDVAFTLAIGRRRFNERRAVVASSRKDAIEALRAGHPQRSVRASAPAAPRLAFLFPGGGAQYPGMGADLYATEPVFRARVDACLDLLTANHGLNLRPIMFPAPGDQERAAAEMVRPSIALPALLTIELAQAELLKFWGLTPAAMLGHSMGEYAAAYLAGVFSLRDVLAVVACRGRLFETLPAGAMLAVPLPEADVVPELVPGLSFAASNGPGLSLVSGEVSAIAQLESRFTARGVEARRLAITVAAHSQMLDPILAEFETYLRSLRMSTPTAPFVSNVTGTWIRPEEARDPLYWVRHLRQPVRFAEGLSTLVEQNGCALIEVGPGRTLTSLAQAHPSIGMRIPATQSLRHPHDPATDRETLLTAIGQLWVAGFEANWRVVFGPGRRRVSVPTYSFDHERHWIEPGDGFFLRADAATRRLEKHADRSRWTYRPVWRLSDRESASRPSARNIVVFEDDNGLGRELTAELRAMGHSVSVARRGDAFARSDEATFELRADNREDHAALLRELGATSRNPAQIIHLWSVDRGTPGRNGEDYFFPLTSLAQALIDEDWGGRVDLVVVTNGAEAVGAETAPAFPLKALTQGPVRVVPREIASIACRSVDLGEALDSPLSIARELLAEVETATNDKRVALRGGERFVESYERAPLEERSGAWPLRRGGVVLITGGLGGISLALAERMAHEAQARFILVGRSAMPRREEWAAVLADLDAGDPVAIRIRGIQAVEAAGGSVHVESADVADVGAMRRVVAVAEARFGSVDAAIHAAGVIDDAPVHAKERGRLESVLRPKVEGAIALAEALEGRRLDFLLLFSSTSAALGPAGQVDYVSANAFLNAYARQLAARGVPARAVQWGAWREVGMAVAALAPVAPMGGMERVAHPLLQRRAAKAEGRTVFRATLTPASHWVLDEHRVRGAQPILPGTGFLELARAAIASAENAVAGTVIELDDISFVAPLVVAEKSSAIVETEVQRDGGELTVSVRSAIKRGAMVEHATGRGRVVTGWAPGALEIAAIEARCTLRREQFGVGEQQLPQERLLAFGPRWKSVRSIAFGHGEALVRLELPDSYAEDLPTFQLHPALMDMASGAAFSLIGGAAGDSRLIVPLSYGRVRVGGPLPQRLVSHVRLRPESTDGVGVLDMTLTDERGRVVAQIDGYVVKAVEPAVLKPSATPERTSSLERWVEHGILPDEGFDVLGRILDRGRDVQVLVSPLDLHALIAELQAPVPHAPAPAPAAGAPAGEPSKDAPRDDIEHKLAALWSELLGVERVGLSDAFFDLGGHSLIAVRLFARIRKIWNLDFPLATLFRAPTLETLAAEVRQRLGLTLVTAAGNADAGASVQMPPPLPMGWSPVVMIRKGGSRRPFFCVHGAGGNLLNFRDFSEKLSPEQPVYGLEARGVDGQLPPAGTIEEMAALYLEGVRREQPNGPYVLGGYSGGGVVALEMARTLVAAGEAVERVVLLDTFHPSAAARTLGWRDHLESLRQHGLRYLAWSVSAVITRRTTWARRNEQLQQCLERGDAVPHELREWHITTSFIDALKRHTALPYAGPVTMFRARDIANVYAHIGPRLGWDATTLPALEIVEVPGGHDSLVREPNVRILATGLEHVLAEAFANGERRTLVTGTGDRKVTVGV